MKSLEQDALKAQMVIAKSRDSKKRGTLDQLTESPSPAPTPSPTPIEGKTLLSLVPSTVACMIQRYYLKCIEKKVKNNIWEMKYFPIDRSCLSLVPFFSFLTIMLLNFKTAKLKDYLEFLIFLRCVF